jgi:hypothetical protein
MLFPNCKESKTRLPRNFVPPLAADSPAAPGRTGSGASICHSGRRRREVTLRVNLIPGSVLRLTRETNICFG